MGKKSKRNRNTGGGANASSASTPTQTPTATATAPTYYPSDGPSNEELNCLQTSSDSLQAKLDLLTSLALANDRAGFVSQFVPLDLTPQDTQGYLQDLTTAPEAEGQWANLASEIAVLAAGKGVTKIEGDQQTRAVFFFEHPLLPGCDREVTFVCAPGSNEWRAEG
jgi:hypothetical protein